MEKLPFLWKAGAVIHMRFHVEKSFACRAKCGYPQHPQLYGYYVYLTLFYSLISFSFPGDNETCAAWRKEKRGRKNPLPGNMSKGCVFVADGEHLPICRKKDIEMSQPLRPARVRRRNARTRHSWTHHPLKKCGTALPDREDFQGMLSFAVRF